jgi:hypothetical protein
LFTLSPQVTWLLLPTWLGWLAHLSSRLACVRWLLLRMLLHSSPRQSLPPTLPSLIFASFLVHHPQASHMPFRHHTRTVGALPVCPQRPWVCTATPPQVPFARALVKIVLIRCSSLVQVQLRPEAYACDHARQPPRARQGGPQALHRRPGHPPICMFTARPFCSHSREVLRVRYRVSLRAAATAACCGR